MTGAFSLANFANPVYFFCGLIGAVENTTAPETAKLCAQYLGPALRLLNFNYLPFPINPYLSRRANPDNMIYTDPKLAPEAQGPATRPNRCRRCRRTPASGDVPPPAGLGTATGTVDGTRPPKAAGIPSPALFPGAPIRAPHRSVADGSEPWQRRPRTCGAARAGDPPGCCCRPEDRHDPRPTRHCLPKGHRHHDRVSRIAATGRASGACVVLTADAGAPSRA